MGLVGEFKKFAMRGNVMDMAVGVIIGAAFGKIVNSMINDMIMPVIGIFGKADFSNMYIGLTEKVREAVAANETAIAAALAADTAAPAPLALADARAIGPVLAYGNFITEVLNFLILAFAIFMMIRFMNKLKAKEEAAPPPPPPGPSAEEKVLMEIRDLLRAQN